MSRGASRAYLRYKAPTVVLDAKIKPFVPDYIPAIGEVDAFIKMPRPDGQPEILGLNTLVCRRATLG